MTAPPRPENQPSAFDLRTYLDRRRTGIDAALDEVLPPAAARPHQLHEAMRYAVFSGGKRLRPLLCLAACENLCGTPDPARLPALAVEILHTYTLVHDDLPSMDDDMERRGQPTVHVKYGEANAILAGDALQALAFDLAARTPSAPLYPPHCFVSELARAAGSRGVVGGQVEDLQAVAGPERGLIRSIHLRKTAVLFRAALRMGACAANASRANVEACGRYGLALGMAFQIADDVLDETAPAANGGRGETTCLSVWSPTEARAHAAHYIDAALRHLAALPACAREPLVAIAQFVVQRTA